MQAEEVPTLEWEIKEPGWMKGTFSHNVLSVHRWQKELIKIKNFETKKTHWKCLKFIIFRCHWSNMGSKSMVEQGRVQEIAFGHHDSVLLIHCKYFLPLQIGWRIIRSQWEPPLRHHVQEMQFRTLLVTGALWCLQRPPGVLPVSSWAIPWWDGHQ